MPLIDSSESQGGLKPQADLMESQGDAGYLDLVGVAYDTVTSQGQIGQAAGFLAQSMGADRTVDPNFDLTDEELAGYEDIAYELLTAGNKEQADLRKKRYDFEKQQDAYLAENGMKGALAMLNAAAVDLTNFIPVAGMEKAAFNLSRIGKVANAAKTGAAYGFAISAGQEAIAQEARISRTTEESFYNIGATTILGGALGGTLGIVAKNNVDQVAESFAKESANYADGLAARYGDSVGAAAVPKTTIEQETVIGALGLEKALKSTSPTLSLMSSSSVSARRTIQELADIGGLEVKKFQEGIAAPIPVESLIRQHEARLTLITPKTFDDYMQYRAGRKAKAGDFVITGVHDIARGAPEGKLTFSQFREEVGKAMARNDEHEIAEVAAAAKRYREVVFDPLKDEAIALGLLPENIEAKTAATYISRLYNTEKIIQQRPDFEARITAWLQRGNKSAEARFDAMIKQAEIADKVIEPNVQKLKALQDELKQIKAKDKETVAEFVERKRTGKRKEPTFTKQDKDRMAELRREIDDINRIIRVNQEKAARFRGFADDVRKIASMSPDDLADLSRQITDGLIGLPAGKLHYEGVPLVRGPLKERTLLITDAEIEDFLDRDIFRIAAHYSRTMSADIELTRAFGKADMRDQIVAINDDYAALRKAAEKELKGDELAAKLKELDNAFRGDVERLEGVRDRLRHTYGIPANPMGLFSRSFRVLKTLNYLRLLGGMTPSSIPDIARSVTVHGVMRVFGDGIAPMIKNFKQAKLAMKEAELAGTALDMINNERALAMAGLDNTWMQTSKFERGLDALADNFKYVSLMAPWTAGLKKFVALVSQTRSLEAIEMVAKGGAASQKEIARLAKFGIDKGMAGRIWKQVEAHGKKDGIWWANTNAWDDLEAVQAYRAAMQREIDNTIVTPGQELPLFMSREMGGLMTQFKSFAMASTQRVLISGLQQRDMATLNGFMLSVGLGMLVYRLKTDHDKLSDDPAKWVLEGIDRAGAMGWFMEANNMIEKVSGGAFGVNPILGTGTASRYSSRGAAAAVFGPSFGTVFDTIIPLIAAASNGEATQSDIHRLRQMLPYQNLFYIRAIFDKAEENINQIFGIPKTKK
jgi:hypothetical protein